MQELSKAARVAVVRRASSLYAEKRPEYGIHPIYASPPGHKMAAQRPDEQADDSEVPRERMEVDRRHSSRWLQPEDGLVLEAPSRKTPPNDALPPVQSVLAPPSTDTESTDSEQHRQADAAKRNSHPDDTSSCALHGTCRFPRPATERKPSCAECAVSYPDLCDL